MTLSSRDEELTELMDDPAADAERLRRTLLRFSIVNRLVSGWDAVYRSHVRPLLTAADRPLTVCDIGCGAGDILRRLLRRARRDGFSLSGLGIDPDARAIDAARSLGPVPGLSYRRVSSTELAAEGTTFDLVISNHLLHHLRRDAFEQVLTDSEALARRLALHSDIERSRVAYAAYAVGITPLSPGTFLRTDGLRSIRRSYRHEELTGALPSGWSAERPRPFRLLAVHRPTGRR